MLYWSSLGFCVAKALCILLDVELMGNGTQVNSQQMAFNQGSQSHGSHRGLWQMYHSRASD